MEMLCRKIVVSNDDSWDEIRRAFQGAAECRMGQTWLPAPDPRFRPAVVRAAWREGDFLVYAELEDDDAFNPLDEFNGMLFMHGDVLEIFLRPENMEPYFEFHVTPQNQKFQLRIPSAEEFQRSRSIPGTPREWFIAEPVLFSRVLLEPVRKRWSVFAAIPLKSVAGDHAPVRGTRWKFSFSRYDYTRGNPKPVHSSTSPHRHLNFHVQDDWGTLTFI